MSRKGKSPAATGGGVVLVAKLRFPEFCSYPVQYLQLADVTTESTERSCTDQAQSQFMGVSKFHGIMPMEDRLVAADTARYKFVRNDWFAYNPMRLNIGSIARWQGDNDILVSPDYVVFKCKSDGPHKIDPAYLDHFRHSTAWDKFVSEKGDGSVRIRIYYKDLARIQLVLPSFPEQQKIADCLDSADALIAAQGRKVEALKTHKKGLMQQLFPQDGETQPRLRFHEFKGAGEWIRSTIGEFKPFVTSGSRGWAAFYADEGDLFIRITNLWRDSIHLDLSDVKFVHLPINAIEGTRTKIKKQDVLISITADIGIIGYVDESVPSPAYINQHIALVRFEENQLCSKFVAYFLASEGAQRLFRASTDNGTKAGMNLIGIQNIGLWIPPIPEQQRIADCLTSLDDLINAEVRKLDTLKTHKKGLMQQLFPQVGEG